MRAQKQNQALCKRRGRQEPNAPRVDQDILLACLLGVMGRHGAAFSNKSKKSYLERYWDLYKDLLMLAPAVAIAYDKPVSIYGVGSFKIKTSSKGKRLRVRYSPAISRFLDKYIVQEYSGDNFWRVFSSLTGSAGVDKYVLDSGR